MTVVAAIAHEGRVIMGADTAVTYGGDPVYRARKIVRLSMATPRELGGVPVGEALLAFSGAGMTVPLVQSHLTLDYAPRADDVDDQDQWAQTIAEAVTSMAVDTPAGPTSSDGDGSTNLDGAGLLAHQGRLWYLFTNLATPVPNGVASLGSGSQLALGAMHAALNARVEPLQAVQQAVALACRYTQGCGIDEGGPLVECLT